MLSSSADKSINIYRKDSYDLQISIKEHSDSVYFVNQLLNGNNTINIIKLINEDKYIFEQKLNEHKYTINNIKTGFYIRELCIIEDDILCIGGFESNCFYLIKISTHQIIKNIVGPKIIYSIYKCFDGLFLCSIKNDKDNYSLVKYKYENQNLTKIVEREKAHESDIYTCIELNDGTIVSGGKDNLIKLWIN